MRVYEFAKLLNVTNKELLSLLIKQGFDVKSHMTALSPEAIEFLNTKLKPSKNIEQQEQKIITQQPPSKSAQAPTPKKIEIPVESAPKKEIIDQKDQKISSGVEEKKSLEMSAQAPEIILENMTVGQLAERLGKPASEVIIELLKQGVMCAKNQMLSEKQVGSIARHYGAIIKHQQLEKKSPTVQKVVTTGAHVRKPIVVVIGHVDHGKTTLLDFIRKTRVASREKGGITQHLGAYEAQTSHGGLVFLDTPGHAAFKNIRGHGLNIADIAILVVAADDSVMPQTIEAIKTAQAAQVPIIVAINKMDKADPSRVEIVKRDLARYDLVPEEWGGQTICVPISAKTGTGVDNLLELIVLQSEVMDLRADEERTAEGFVLESKVEKGRGPVATIICRSGTLKVGDYFVAGSISGRVTSITNSYGQTIKSVGPSIPVQVAGFPELAQAGDIFKVIRESEYRKIKDSRVAAATLSLPQKMASGEGVRFIVKTDSTLTQEALIDSLAQLAEKNTQNFNIIATGVGDVTESDIMLASDTGSEILGLHVRMPALVSQEAQKYSVDVHLYDIIYKLLESLEERLASEAPVKMVAKKIGEAVIRKVFDIKNVGIIAGAYVREGRFTKDARVIVWRGKKKLGEGKIKGLERDRKSVKEVHAGFEFAFSNDGFNEWEIDDRVECFIDQPAA